MTPNNRILVIDDDFDVWKAYRMVLAPAADEDEHPLGAQLTKLLAGGVPATPPHATPVFQLQHASQGQAGFHLAQEALAAGEPFAVAFVDVRMPPGWDGLETAERIRAIDPDIEIVIVTAYSDRSREEIARRIRPPEKLLFFRKPFDTEELLQLAISLTEKWNLGHREQTARDRLAESRARFQALVEATSDWLWESDTEGRFTYVSPISEMVYGFRPEELLDQHYDVLLPEAERPIFQNFLALCIRGMHGFNGIARCCRKKDGSEVYIESSAVPIVTPEGIITGFRGIDRDVTDRKREQEKRALLEEQYRQSQKMEGLGTLAGGIAHDLNNLLTPILGFSEICLLKTGSNSPIQDHLKSIIQSANRASELIRRILAFSRKQVMVAAPLNLNQIINEFSKMLRRLIREDVEFRFDLEDDLWNVHADASQLEQVLINLIVNARDAVNENGVITVRTRNRSLGADDHVCDIGNNPVVGSFVELSVRDNGAGMSKETVQRIFDPFFTTKDIGKGTGLGLATVYGIMTQHGAAICLETAVGQGSTFTFFLPRLTDAVPASAASASLRQVEGGCESLLVAEDDKDVRAIICNTLQFYGYKVCSATNGAEAAKLAAERNYRFDLLVTDIIMPGMSGKTLAETLRREITDLPVLFISGYPQDVIPAEVLAEPRSDFLRKPFTPQELAKRIRQLLDVER